MTVEEASRIWDLHFNNLNSNQAPAIDDYEKSIFITDAQDQFMNGMLMPSHLVVGLQSVSISQLANITAARKIKPVKADNQTTLFLPTLGKSIVYDLRNDDNKNDIFAILNVEIVSNNHNVYTATFLNFDEMDRIHRKPYPYPPKRICYACIREDNSIEILAHDKEEIEEVQLRYVKQPYPIILNNGDSMDFADDDTVRGEKECYSKTPESISPLPDSIVEQIIKLACNNASQVYQQGGAMNNNQQQREQQ